MCPMGTGLAGIREFLTPQPSPVRHTQVGQEDWPPVEWVPSPGTSSLPLQSESALEGCTDLNAPSPVGKDGLEVGQHRTDKRFCRALLSPLRSLCGARRPIWPLSDLLASDAPFERGQAPCPGWFFIRCPHLPAPRQGTPLPPLTTNTRDAFLHPSPSIVFKETISDSQQAHLNAPPFSPTPIS